MSVQVVGHDVVIQKAPAERYVMLFMASFFAVAFAALVIWDGSQIKPVSQPVALLGCLLLLLFGIASAGPSELRVNPQRRRYTLTKGIAFFPRIVQGPIEDIRELVVRTVQAEGSGCLYLEIRWRDPKRNKTTLCVVRQIIVTEAEIQLKGLGVPVRWL